MPIVFREKVLCPERRASSAVLRPVAGRLTTGSWDPDLDHDGAGAGLPARSWVWRLLYILYSLEVGVFLVFLPWLAIWENNYLLYLFPDFRPLVANSYLKGAVLGLGVVNIVIGIEEIGLFRKRSRRRIGSSRLG